MAKFTGETAYAILCPHCDESLLCKHEEFENEDRKDDLLSVHMYPTREDADVAARFVHEKMWNYHKPEVILVRISPIEYTMNYATPTEGENDKHGGEGEGIQPDGVHTEEPGA